MTALASEYTAAWNAFQATQALRLQQEALENEWSRGRRDFVAFLIAVSDDEVRQHIAGQAAQIAGIPGVEPYPEHYWHITVKQVGYLADSPSLPDEVSVAQIQRLAEDARPIIEGTSRFMTGAGIANAFAEVVFLETPDGSEVRALNKRLLGLPNLYTYPIDGDVFLPHISIASFSSHEGLPLLKETLSKMRTQAAGPSFEVREVLLIQAHLSTRAPEFELLARYPLRED